MSAPLTGFWIKSHSAILEDVTIATLPDNLWRRYNELKHLLAHDATSGELPDVKAIAFRLRVLETQLVGELGELSELGLIGNEGDNYNLPHFAQEQSPDSVKDRVAKHRETKLKRDCNEPVTKSYLEESREDKRREEKKDIPQGEPACVSDSLESKASKPRKSKPTPDNDPDFAAFWDAYPRKADKQKAFAAWSKAKLPAIADILAAIEAQKASEQWQKEGGKFVPYPTTWINGERWHDEVPNYEEASNDIWKNAVLITP